VVRVGTSKVSTISLWLQYIRGISYRGPTERKKERKKVEIMGKSALWPDLKFYPGICQPRNSSFGITTPQAETVIQNLENNKGRGHTVCLAHGNIKNDVN
jgi:hypothetical protein